MKKKTAPNEPTVKQEGSKTVVSFGPHYVSIYETREGKRTRYRLKWSIGGPKMQTRNIPTKVEAIQHARDIVTLLNRGEGALTQITVAKMGFIQRLEEAVGDVSLDTVVKFYLDRCVTAFTSIPVETVVDDLIADMEGRIGKRGASERWVQTVRSRARHFADAFPGKLMHEVTTADLKSVIFNPEWSDRTKFNFQQVVRIIYEVAKDRAAVPKHDSAYDLLKPKLQKTGGAEKDVLAPAHLRALLRAAHATRKDFLPYLSVCAFAGVRAEEASRLRWGTHVDMAERIIRLTQDITKTSRRRIVEMNETLFLWLSAFQGEDGELLQPYENAARILTELWRDEAKIPVWPHNALRVSFISYSMALTPNAAAVASAAGHSETMLQTEYKQIRGVNKNTSKEWFDSSPKAVIPPTST